MSLIRSEEGKQQKLTSDGESEKNEEDEASPLGPKIVREGLSYRGTDVKD